MTFWIAKSKNFLRGRGLPSSVWILGSSASMSAAVCLLAVKRRGWNRGPRFLSVPSLAERGSADGVGALYSRALELGELMTFPGRITFRRMISSPWCSTRSRARTFKR